MQSKLLSLLLAIIGGAFNGAYPLFIKTPRVLAANVHPVIFQCYKSGMVFLTGFLFLIPRYIHYSKSHEDGERMYEFTYWGMVSAAAWVPSGITTIFAVPRIGMSMTMAVSSATSSVLSFLVFWLVFGSKMKTYSCGKGCTYFRAPIYLVTCVMGMFVMIFSKKVATWAGFKGESDSDSKEAKPLLINEDDVKRSSSPKNSTINWLAGMLSATLSGTFGALQYGLYTFGKKHEYDRYTDLGCTSKNTTACPPSLIEEFNTFGSWMISFGLGAAAMVSLVLTIVSFVEGSRPPTDGDDRCFRVPSFNFGVLKIAGVSAGTFWALGNFLNTTAVKLGGNAVIMAQTLSSSIITSGLLGIFYYGEGGSFAAKVIWAIAAAWTLASMVLLGLEKS